MTASDYTYDKEKKVRTYIPTGESLRFIPPPYREEPPSYELRILSGDGRKMNTCLLNLEHITPTHNKIFGRGVIMEVPEEDIIKYRDNAINTKDLYDKYGQWRVITSTDIPWKEYPNPDGPIQKFIDFASAQLAHSHAINPNHMNLRLYTEIHFIPNELPKDQWSIWVLNEAKTQYLRKL